MQIVAAASGAMTGAENEAGGPGLDAEDLRCLLIDQDCADLLILFAGHQPYRFWINEFILRIRSAMSAC